MLPDKIHDAPTAIADLDVLERHVGDFRSPDTGVKLASRFGRRSAQRTTHTAGKSDAGRRLSFPPLPEDYPSAPITPREAPSA
jgi:hypothetical protein